MKISDTTILLMYILLCEKIHTKQITNSSSYDQVTLPGSYCFTISIRYSKNQKAKVSVASSNTKLELKEKSRTMILKAWYIKVETDF